MYQEPYKLIVKPHGQVKRSFARCARKCGSISCVSLTTRLSAPQLELSDQERKEEHTRVLTANDPNVPTNITKYNYKDRQYKVRPLDGLRNAPAPFSVSGVRGVVANQSSLLVVSPPNDRLTLRVLVTT